MSYIITPNGTLIPAQNKIMLTDTVKYPLPSDFSFRVASPDSWNYSQYVNIYGTHDGAYPSYNYVDVANGSIILRAGFLKEGEYSSQYAVLTEPFKNNSRFLLEGYYTFTVSGSNNYGDANYTRIYIGFAPNSTSTEITPLFYRNPIHSDRLQSGEVAIITFSYTCEIRNDVLYYKGFNHVGITDKNHEVGSMKYDDSQMYIGSSKNLIIHQYHQQRSTVRATDSKLILTRVMLY